VLLAGSDESTFEVLRFQQASAKFDADGATRVVEAKVRRLVAA
jgi:hypothetical protein